MHWTHSNLNPPSWWQLEAEHRLFDIFIQRRADGFHIFIGQGALAKVGKQGSLTAAQQWAINETLASLKTMQRDLQPHRDWTLLGCSILGIALLVIYLLLFAPIWA